MGVDDSICRHVDHRDLDGNDRPGWWELLRPSSGGVRHAYASSAMVDATAFMGLLGHTAAGDFNALWAIPMSIAAVLGGFLGGALSLRTRPEKLKRIFAYTTLGAAVFMALNAWLSLAAQR